MESRTVHRNRSSIGRIRFLPTALLAIVAAACSSKPMVPYTTDATPQALLPVASAGIDDQRGRFREVVCAIMADHGEELPHYRPCDEILVKLGREPPGTGAPVNLGAARIKLAAAFVPGVGWECIQNWINYQNEFAEHIGKFTYDSHIFKVDGLSGTDNNARQIRDTILEFGKTLEPKSLVLVGYSKGAPDILTALVNHPEIRPYVAAVVSVAGAVGGSPLAYDATEGQLDLLRYVPEADCSVGDGKGIESLRPAVRQNWLSENPLPQEIRYYSLVTYPLPDRVSSILKGTHKKLSQIDPRNDSQVIFYDQIIPGSTLMGYLNADHWAAAVPIAEEHPFIGRHFVDRNDFPRTAIAEALMRFVEEDLEKQQQRP
jgi:pimeloyl-ACP methyl ester carboxylesterase